MTGQAAVWRRTLAVVACLALLGLSGVTLSAAPGDAATTAAAHRTAALVEFTIDGRVLADLPPAPRPADKRDAGPTAALAAGAAGVTGARSHAGPAVAMWSVRAAHAHGRRGRAPPTS